MKVCFIGGGNMATALIGGRINAGADPRDFAVIDPFDSQRDTIARRFAGIACFASPSEDAVKDSALVVLAVKPQQMRAASTALAPFIERVPAVLTIAAGIRIADIARWLRGYRRIVRAMPNTPALIGAGISGAYASDGVDAAAREAANTVLGAAGEVIWCAREDELDAVTAVSGSGPAYVFYFLEGLEEAARNLGIAPPDARKLAYATVDGAIKLAQRSDADPATLRAQVTSKGGTTERAVATLEAHSVKKRLIEAVANAAARAAELGDEFGKDA